MNAIARRKKLVAKLRRRRRNEMFIQKYNKIKKPGPTAL